MAVTELNELIKGGLDRAVELMAIAAHNSYRFGKTNNTKIISIGHEEMQQIGEFCYSLADMSPLAARDGRAMKELIAMDGRMLIIGEKRKSDLNWNCGACGYRTCAELNKAEEVEALTGRGPSCQFKNLNVMIAANAAASAAWRLGLYCRVYSTYGMSALAMSVIEDVDITISVATAAGKSDPFFDRHQYWTPEFWDEIFKKEFPTYDRGFIGAIEE
jgi:uncharacterized ferredoxin-like protein